MQKFEPRTTPIPGYPLDKLVPLSNIPTELHVMIASMLSEPDRIRLQFVNRYFQQLVGGLDTLFFEYSSLPNNTELLEKEPKGMINFIPLPDGGVMQFSRISKSLWSIFMSSDMLIIHNLKKMPPKKIGIRCDFKYTPKLLAPIYDVDKNLKGALFSEGSKESRTVFIYDFANQKKVELLKGLSRVSSLKTDFSSTALLTSCNKTDTAISIFHLDHKSLDMKRDIKLSEQLSSIDCIKTIQFNKTALLNNGSMLLSVKPVFGDVNYVCHYNTNKSTTRISSIKLNFEWVVSGEKVKFEDMNTFEFAILPDKKHILLVTNGKVIDKDIYQDYFILVHQSDPSTPLSVFSPSRELWGAFYHCKAGNQIDIQVGKDYSIYISCEPWRLTRSSYYASAPDVGKNPYIIPAINETAEKKEDDESYISNCLIS